jgi:D-alanyl-D-alanine carboxypeptidase
MTRRHLSRALLGLVLIFATTSASARPASYQAILDQVVARGVPGVQAYVRRGRSEWSGVSGYASLEQRRRMTADDRIRVASITKMMTYAVIMELVEQGKLKRSDRAVDRLPRGALAGIPHAGEITIDHLLEHRSGLHNFNDAPDNDFFRGLYLDPRRGQRMWTAPQLLDFARRKSNPPTGRPGEKQSYSSTGYIVLEMIAEHVSGERLAALYRRLIFAPLGMRRTGVEGADLRARDIADSYSRPDGPVRAVSAFRGRRPVRPDGLTNLSRGLVTMNSWARGAGAVASTAGDLGRFMRAVEAGRLTVLKDQPAEFARVKARPKGFLNWNGGSPGIQASIIHAPARDTTIIVLTNSSNIGEGSLDIARRLLEASDTAAR